MEIKDEDERTQPEKGEGVRSIVDEGAAMTAKMAAKMLGTWPAPAPPQAMAQATAALERR